MLPSAATLSGMDLDPNNPLHNTRWVKDIGDAVWNYVTKEAEARATAARKDAQDLTAVHREGWKNTAAAIERGFGLVADAIRAHGH